MAGTIVVLRPNQEGIDNSGNYADRNNSYGGSLSQCLADGTLSGDNFTGNRDDSLISGNSTGTVVLGFTSYTLAADERCRAMRLIQRAGETYTGLNHTVTASIGNYTEGQWRDDVYTVGAKGNFHGTWRTTWPNGNEIGQSQINSVQSKVSSTTRSGIFGPLTASIYEQAIQLEIVKRPINDVTGPTGTNPGNTRRPTVTWTPTMYDGYSQKAYQIKVWNTDVNPAPTWSSTSGLVWDSKRISGTATGKRIDKTLPNGNYRAIVRVAKDFNGADWWSTNDDWVAFTINSSPPAPTDVGPSNETVNTSYPTLRARVDRESIDFAARVVAEWQLATDSGFTANVRTFREPNSQADNGSLHQYAIDEAAKLFQGNWYVRARAVTEDGDPGAWSSGVAFTVSHPPTTLGHTPSGGKYLPIYPLTSVDATFQWQFSDTSPNEHMTAYQVIAEIAGTGEVLEDSGKIFSGNPALTVFFTEDEAETELRWKVRAWDEDDVASAYSDYQIFYFGYVPEVVLDEPGTVTTPTHTFTWTYNSPGGRTQTHYRFVVHDDTNDVQAYDSGWITSASDQHTMPPGVLRHSRTYTATVYVRDSANLEVDPIDLAGDRSATFTTSWTPPATITPTVTEEDGYIALVWDSSNEDPNFNSWRVYRRVLGETDATLLLTSTEGGKQSYEFRDYLAEAGTDYEYAVVQVANILGDLVESEEDWQQATITSQNYWLIIPSDFESSMVLHHVTDDGYSLEEEQGEMAIIGRGRRMERGTIWGKRGTLTAQLYDQAGGRTARQQKLDIEAFKRSGYDAYLRTPFGDVFRIAPGNIEVALMAGVGTREFGTITIEYVEVYESDTENLAYFVWVELP